MVAAMDSEDSSLQVGPPRHAASPQPTSPSAVSRRTKTKFTASRVVKDILGGRSTGISAWITRTPAIFMRPPRRESFCPRLEHVGFGVGAPNPAPGQRHCANIHAGRVAVKHDLGHENTDGGRMHEAVPRKGAGDAEAGHFLGRTEYAVIVRRQVPDPCIRRHHLDPASGSPRLTAARRRYGSGGPRR